MKLRLPFLFVSLILAAVQVAPAQGAGLSAPKSIVAGSAFNVQSTGSGAAILYIVGPDQVLKQNVQLGETAPFPAGSLYNAGHYLVILAANSSTQSASLDVIPESEPARINFLAKPTRLPVQLHNDITGAAYVFDAHDNLIYAPMPVSFELSGPSGAKQT
ncbi:MAG: hypothetical protein ACRD19_04980, partial [Terriglobia bacterium]